MSLAYVHLGLALGMLGNFFCVFDYLTVSQVQSAFCGGVMRGPRAGTLNKLCTYIGCSLSDDGHVDTFVPVPSFWTTAAPQQRVPPRPVAPGLAPRATASSTTMTVMCSSLRKERKKMAKVLKSSRKALEKRLQAVTHADADSPVLSDLLMELRTLNERLAGQRAAALLYAADDSSDSSSDSDTDDCNVRPGALFQACAVRPATSSSSSPSLNAMPATPVSVATPASSATGSGSSVSTTMVVSGRHGVVEVAVPEPPAGWEWDEAEFRGMAFEGSGRVMMCTGSK